MNRPVRKPLKKLTPQEVDSLVEDYRSGKYSQVYLAKRYSIATSTVYRHLALRGEKVSGVANPVKRNREDSILNPIQLSLWPEPQEDTVKGQESILELFTGLISRIASEINPFKKKNKNEDTSNQTN
jgi:transposase-like protein